MAKLKSIISTGIVIAALVVDFLILYTICGGKLPQTQQVEKE